MKKNTTISIMSFFRRFYVIFLLMATFSGGFAQNVGINATGAAPNSNAGLDVDFSNKGVLIPRIALVSATSYAPLSAHVAGMIVYNTATTSDLAPGFYYDNGSRWVPSLPAGTATGDMLYWNGAAWVRVPAGSPGQFLQFSPSNIPVWAGASYATITTTTVSAILDISATSGGDISSDGGSPVLTRGICWSTSVGPTIADSKTTDGSGSGSFTSLLTGLTPSTTYYVRAYSINAATVSYGNQVSFSTTTSTLPVLDPTTAATSITSSGAITGGNLISTGDAQITQRGVCYSTTNPPTIADDKVIASGTGLGSFSCTISGLTSNTIYYVRSYAINSAGTGYGDVTSFTTLAIVTSTTAASSITTTTAASGGTITAGGGADITERGVCWSTSASPTITDSKTSDGTGTGLFTSSITGLAYTTLYHVRAFATNAGGTVYGNDITFTTLTPVAPTVAATTAASAITGNSATSGGNITSTGGAPITERGVCYGTGSNPTILTGTKVIDPSPGTGTFTSNLSNLTGGTTYYVRAYAINSAGTSYGTQISFMTTVIPPTLVTAVATNIGNVSVTSGGSMSWNGGGYSNYQNYGVAYSTTQGSASPNFVATNTLNGSVNQNVPITPWVTNITGLAANTTYYIRAYLNLNRISPSGWVTVFGDELSFTTAGATAPEVATTTTPTVTSANTATSGGTIANDGGSTITAKGVCWSTSPNPVLGVGNFTTDGTGTSLFGSYITGLSGSTFYYVRAYATNTIGTSYGPTVTMTTWVQAPYTMCQNVGYGWVAYVAQDGTGFIVSPAIESEGGWGCSGTSIATSSALGSGLANTDLILSTCATRPIAASIAKGYNGGGFNDWYLPSSGEWAKMAAYPAYTCSGVGTGLNQSYTSTQSSATYAVTYFSNSNQPYSSSAAKTGDQYTQSIRAIRNFAASAPVAPTVLTTAAVSGIGATSATSGGYVSSDGGATATRGVCWNTAGTPTTTNSKTTDGTGIGAFTSSITGLTAGLTYYVRAYATNSAGTSYGPEVSFIPVAPGYATVTTAAISAITSTGGVSGGEVLTNGGGTVSARGVCWSTGTVPVLGTGNFTTDGSGLGTFTSTMTDLTQGTLYYVRAYATNGAGTSYGSELSFTPHTYASLTTTAISNITGTTASSGGNISSNGGATVTVSGVCWSTTSPAELGTSNFSTDGSATGAYTSSITGLLPGTSYYVRAYATNASGTAYGSNEVNFTTTGEAGAATVTTADVTSIGGTSGNSGGNVTSDGGATVTSRGVCWSTTSPPSIGTGNYTTDGSGTGEFISEIRGLTPDQLYYVRAYAINSEGTAYGTEVSFTPTGNALPEVTTASTSNLTGNSVTCGGNVTSDGGAPVYWKGVCYGTNPIPRLETDLTTADGSGTGSFISNVYELITGETYYIRAFAYNDIGVGYGAVLSFTPTGEGYPTLSTDAVTDPTATGGTSGGNITNNGGSPVTVRGICWNQSGNPTISDTKTSDGSGSGTFTSTISGLTPGNYYYIRAYATNGIGTAYGQEMNYQPVGPPTIATLSLIYTAPDDFAKLPVRVSNTGGGTISAYGVVWGTTASPTVSSHLGITAEDLFNFSNFQFALISSLNPDGTETYYIRAYATNENGTSYGTEIIFTPGVAGFPTVQTDPILNKVGAWVEGGGTVLSDGGEMLSSAGLCWGADADPTVDLNLGKTTDGYAGQFFSAMTLLTVGSTYHVRAYATNSHGTAYGADITFTATAATLGQLVQGGNIYANVFSVDGTGEHGLMAIPYAYGSAFVWGCTGSTIGTSTAMGSGLANTNAIITACTESIPSGLFAANFAATGWGPGWYLPSKDELSLMWTNRVAASINFSTGANTNIFWSSSEDDADNAWYINGTTGSWVSGAKTGELDFFSIRSF